MNLTIAAALLFGWLITYLIIGKTTKGRASFLSFLVVSILALVFETYRDASTASRILTAATSVCVIPMLYSWVKSTAEKKISVFEIAIFLVIIAVAITSCCLANFIEGEELVTCGICLVEFIYVAISGQIISQKANASVEGRHISRACANAALCFALVWAACNAALYLTDGSELTKTISSSVLMIPIIWLMVISLFTQRETLDFSDIVNLEVKQEETWEMAENLDVWPIMQDGQKVFEGVFEGEIEEEVGEEIKDDGQDDGQNEGEVDGANEVDGIMPCEPMDDKKMRFLQTKFEDLIINQQQFLKTGLTLTDIAEILGSNKTYLSRMVNSTYGMTFPEYLNSLRIDYAKEYLQQNKDARQDEIARVCGFPNASSFNSTFKKVVGVTPRIWLATKK